MKHDKLYFVHTDIKQLDYATHSPIDAHHYFHNLTNSDECLVKKAELGHYDKDNRKIITQTY